MRESFIVQPPLSETELTFPWIDKNPDPGYLHSQIIFGYTHVELIRNCSILTLYHLTIKIGKLEVKKCQFSVESRLLAKSVAEETIREILSEMATNCKNFMRDYDYFLRTTL